MSLRIGLVVTDGLGADLFVVRGTSICTFGQGN
jgi:hypothetical protein